MTETKIRTARFSDCRRGVVAELLREAYAAEPAIVEIDCADWDKFDDFVFERTERMDRCGFVTMDGDEPVGFVTWDPRELPARVHVGHNCVRPGLRGRGIGTAQMRLAVERILESGPAEIVVSTGDTPFFEPARRMYLAAGFREFRRFPLDPPREYGMVEYIIRPDTPEAASPGCMPGRGYQALVFDFDYTLGDATEGIVLAMNHALTGSGNPPAEREAIRRTVGMSLSEAFRTLTGLSDAERTQRFLALFREKGDEVMTPNTVLYEGTAPLLRRLHAAGVRTGIVTTKFRYRIAEILRKFDIEPLVDTVVGGEDVSRPKPDPEGIRTAAAALGVSLGHVLYIGDSVIDAQTASAAGVDFIGVTTGTTGRDALAAYPALEIFDRLDRLGGWLYGDS